MMAAISIWTLSAYSQISQGGQPDQWENKNIPPHIPFVKMPILNMDAINAEDAVVDEYKESPFRFGISHSVDYDLFTSGVSQELSNGDKIWRMGIDCPDAKSINFIFGEYFIPEGGKVFVYNESKSEFIGSFTSSNNKPYGSLAVGLVHSNRIIIEYFEPSSVANQAALVISEITHGYRPVINKFEVDKGPFGNSGSCNMNVNCSDGAAWQDEKRGVGLILQNGNAHCTGSLINNTNQDGTPYFLTAAHCDGNENNWVIYFNHEYAGCSSSGSAPTNQSISGGTQLASTSPSDGHLIELSSNVPASYNPYYNGWDKSGSAVSSAVGIHHPAGDVKKISFDDDPCQKTSYLSDNANGTATHWRIEAWERNTTTEGGSSGSPLFNQDHRIIGQLHGGYASCTTSGSNDRDWYGAMEISFPSFDSYLDPANTNSLVLDGYDPSVPTGPIAFNLSTFLEGPFDPATGQMNDLLRQTGTIPTTEPFTALGFNHVNGGSETTSNAVLNTTGNNAIVDWIFVEVRSGVSPTTILSTQSALLQRDGDIVDVNGTSLVTFNDFAASTVYVVLRHRNHFGVRSANAYSTSNTINVDFTSTVVPLYGGDSMTTDGIYRMMTSGDANRDGQCNSIDKNVNWRLQNGELFDYFNSSGDFDVNGVVNSIDKNNDWRTNNSKQEQLD